MKITSKKSVATTIALLLTLTIAFTLVALPLVAAQDYTEVKTYCFVAPQPKAGVDQTMFIVAWLNEMPRPETGEELTEGRRGAYYGMTLHITKPDGEEETVDMEPSDPVGNNYVLYTPNQQGTYEVQCTFPGNWRNVTYEWRGNPPTDYWYTASESEVRTFEVQEDPVPGWDEAPLPEDYWMRPISGASHRWSEVASHWLGSYAQVYPQGASGGATTSYAYGQEPESAHILWTRQHLPMGGIIDERFGSEAWTLNHYQSVNWGGIIVAGQIHYAPAYTQHGSQGWETVDLYTGEQLRMDYEADAPDRGQVYVYNSPNQHGGFAYLWRTSGVELPDQVTISHAELRGPGVQPPKRLAPSELVDSSEITTGTLWEMLDGYTGNTVCYVANVSHVQAQMFMAPPTKTIQGLDGSILIYNLEGTPNPAGPFAPDIPPFRLTVWNSSAGTMVSSENGTGYWQYRPLGGTFGGEDPYFGGVAHNIVHDGNLMYSLNISVPLEEEMSIATVREKEFVIFADQGQNDDDVTEDAYFIAISLEPGHEGEKLWETSFTPPYAETWAAGAFGNGMSLTEVVPEDEVIIYSDNIQLKRYAYDMRTGEKLWEGEREAPFKFYSFDYRIYNGMLISGGSYSGELLAYNLTTGEIEWEYEAPLEGTESPYGRGTMTLGPIADGKLYTTQSEHSGSTPMWRQPGLRCIDLETGELVWDILWYEGWGGAAMIADGILVVRNVHDGQIYAFGKGPSKTTVTAEPKAVAKGTNVVIEGKVTDQTPTGARNVNNEVEFTLKDTPAISDEDMREWMEYKFMEQGCPQNAKGVPVTLDAINPDGEFVHIGETTSDMSGTYSYIWQPEMEGKYTIIATFEGSDSYYASYDQTAIAVNPTPDETVSPTEQPAWYEEPASPTEQPAWYTEPPETVSPTEQPEWYQKPPDYTMLFAGIIIAIIVMAILVVYTLYTVKTQPK